MRKSILSPIIIVPAIFIFASVIGCTYSSTFPPKLNDKGEQIVGKIKNANHFEEIQLQEKKTSGSGGNMAAIIIKLYNGKGFPTDTVALGKVIADQIKSGLADTAAIKEYDVLFCTRVVSGAMTNTNYTGYKYSPAELSK